MKRILLATLWLSIMPAHAQTKAWDPSHGLDLQLEAQATGSTGNYAPTWLSSNRYGITSPEKWSNYERATLERNVSNDSLRNWKLGYGADIAVEFNAPRTFVVQQAYAELGYKKATLCIGSKQRPLDMRNDYLTSGGMSFGINARPIPQVRLDIDYFNFPGTKGWWKWKAHGSYGMTTDGKWIKSFVQDAQKPFRYTGNILYHEKALYWKFGKEECPVPLVYEISLQMGTQFGGTTYNATGRGLTTPTDIQHSTNAKAFLEALICGGSDEIDGAYKNTAGNHVGSYLMSLGWYGKKWSVKGYFERFFEDQSMLTVQYGIRDHIFGVETQLPRNPFLSSIVVEQMSTRDQSGAVYHDKTTTLPDKMNGIDNYYNNSLYAGWQYYGMHIGHPFLTSPIYNANSTMYCYNNRIKAWHVGLSGNPTQELRWRLLMSFTQNWGTYYYPTNEVEKEQHILAEVDYKPDWAKGWSGTLGIGLDHGNLGKENYNTNTIGNSFGAQLTIRKQLRLR